MSIYQEKRTRQNVKSEPAHLRVMHSSGQSRNIGKFLKPYLEAEGLRCSERHPALYLFRYSVDGSRDFVWSMKQLSDCYSVAVAFQIELFNITDLLSTPEIEIHYASIVVTKTQKGWSAPSVVSDTEDVWLGYDLRKLEERFERFAERASRAILDFLE